MSATKAKISIAEARRLVADYISSEGCGCCRDRDARREHEAALAKLLRVKPYKDGFGYNFTNYRTKDKK